MKFLMIWPLFIFICLLSATIVKLRRDAIDGDDYLKLGGKASGANDGNYKRVNASGGGLNRMSEQL